MAQIFTAHDIAVIAGAFRPDTPTTQQPSLVWNSTGDRLLQSSKVQQKFEKLLLQDGERIPLSTLSKPLDTRQTEWCLASHHQPLVYSADRKSIFSSPEVDRMLASILESAQKQYTELERFLASRDVDRDSFKPSLEQSAELEMLTDTLSKSRTWVASKDLHLRTCEEIESLLRHSPDDRKTDLSAKLTGVPESLIQSLAEQISQQHNIPGTIRSSRTRITFLSAAYEVMLAEEMAKKIAQEMSKILVHTYRHGYHKVPKNSEDAPRLREVFFQRTQDGIDDGSFSMIHSNDIPIAVAFTNRLEDVLDEIKAHACDLAVDSWNTHGDAQTPVALDVNRIEQLIDRSSSQEFARLVLEDAKYRAAVEKSMSTKLDELESTDLKRCNEGFNEYVRLPIRLYLAGLNNVKDPSLRQRLEDYVLEFLSKDVVPTGIQHAENEKHLSSKALAKELERFGQTCLEATSLYELQSSLSKFVRKQKLESVSDVDELEVKHRILQQKLKAMRRMIRGSDILQNLVWILLAQEYEGLFISSGRDTTRMIRFYQSTGNAEIGKRLEAWKDEFKAGHETRDDFENMRSLAAEVVSRLSGRIEQQAVHGE